MIINDINTDKIEKRFVILGIFYRFILYLKTQA